MHFRSRVSARLKIWSQLGRSSDSMTAEEKAERNLVAIDSLKGHEQTDPLHLEKLKKEILKDGHQRDPIVVDVRTNVILDGHHRSEIFRSMGLAKIAAHMVDYSDPGIQVRSWYPTFNAEPKLVANTVGLRLEGDPQGGGSGITLTWAGGTREIPGDRARIMGALVGRFPIVYVEDQVQAENMISSGRAKAFLAMPPVRKEDVIRCALSGNKLPPKTTRHIFPRRPLPVLVPLGELSH